MIGKAVFAASVSVLVVFSLAVLLLLVVDPLGAAEAQDRAKLRYEGPVEIHSTGERVFRFEFEPALSPDPQEMWREVMRRISAEFEQSYITIRAVEYRKCGFWICGTVTVRYLIKD